ncbi:MAG: CDP-glycerol glycerophosphotransferase family protein, partial [Clostridia bacterium]|nr:CDP-glycerol glycerophosphotransferase family protein [Clostridia bacterium]
VEFGFPLADYLAKMGEEENARRAKSDGGVKKILVAPSWQEDNIMDSCIDNIVDGLYGDGYKIIVRPHPEYIKRYRPRLEKIIDKYKDYDKSKLVFETDFSANESVYSSDVLITDWSGIGPEFCFATKRPAIFINTKEKCGNPNWEKIGMTPVEISLRKELGVSLEKEETVNIKAAVKDLIENGESYKQKITDIYGKFLYNHGTAAEAGAKYLLRSLAAKNKK